MRDWQRKHSTTTISTLRPPYGEILGWRKEGRLVVPPNLSLKRKIMFHIHNAVGPKHPNVASTIQQTLQSYWWPGAEEWIKRYVENCKQCHNGLLTIKTTSPMTASLQSKVCEAQEKHHTTLEEWSAPHSIHEEQNGWLKEGHIVIPPDEELRCQILRVLHNAPTAGHPGRDETFTQVSHTYWWPGMRAWITNYITGCTVCQQNKNVTHHKRTPLYHIPTPENALPFQPIVMA